MKNIRSQITRIVNSKNFKHGILYTIFSFVNNGINFILILILAHFLTPYDYGELNLFNTFVTIINIIISLCTTSYITVSFFKKSKKDLRKIILIAFGTSTFMLMIFGSIIMFFPDFVQKLIGVSVDYLLIGLLICYFGIFNSVNLDIWRLEENPVVYGFYSVSFAICNFVLTFIFIVGLKQGWIGRVHAWSILSVIYFFISLVFLIKRRYITICKPSISLIKETLIYAFPIIPHSVSFWLKSGLDRYIINYFYDQSVVGYFSFAANLAAVITVIGNAFNATNSVFIYKGLSEGYNIMKNKLSKQTKIMTIAFATISIVAMFFAWGLISLFLPKYYESLPYIFPLCIGGFFQCIYLLWVNYMFYYNRTKQLMNITLSSAILQVVLSFLLTRYSPIFTAYISMSITAITMLYVRKNSRSLLKQHITNISSEL